MLIPRERFKHEIPRHLFKKKKKQLNMTVINFYLHLNDSQACF